MIELVIIVVALLVFGAALLLAAKLVLMSIASILILAFVFPDQFGNLPLMLVDLAGHLGNLNWAGMLTHLSDWIASILPIGGEMIETVDPGPDTHPAPSGLSTREPGEIRIIE